MIGVEILRPDEAVERQAGPKRNRIRGAIMPAHRKYFNLPESKTCPECGTSFGRPSGYGHDRWFKAEVCSLSCASTRGNRRKAEARAAEFEAIFDSHVNRQPGQGPHGECWEWTGTRYQAGYGRIGLGGRSLKAHRLSLFGVADYDNPLMACHRCDNPACVRPDHLFAGSGLDNTRDKMVKGRHRGNHKLDEQQVASISVDGRTYREIASDYDVSISNVGAIKRGLTWKGA